MMFVLIWAAFVFLLSINFFTLSREGQPSRTSRIGWQEFINVGKSIGYTQAGHSMGDNVDGNDAQELSSDGQGKVTGPSFPLDVFAPLVPNPVPLTEMTVHSCIPISLSSCKPSSTAAEDAALGPWVLVPRPLDSEAMATSSIGATGITGALSHIFGALGTKYIFYRRSRRRDAPRIVDIKLVEVGETPPTTSEPGWTRVHDDLRNRFMRIWAGQKGLHLYYKSVGGNSKPTQSNGTVSNKDGHQRDSLEPITEIEMLYGDENYPWPGFFVVGQVGASNSAMGHSSVWLTARRKPVSNPSVDSHPKFRSDGSYKILQLADLHFSVNEEPCRDVHWESPEKPCHSVNDTMRVIEGWLDAEEPDLVVFTGDQLNGQTTSWDAKSIVTKFVKPVIDRKIQWAAILGNHDSQQTSISRAELVLLLSRLPYSLSRIGPPGLHGGEGAGNYYVSLESPTPDQTNVFNLYFLDSGADAPTNSWTMPWGKANESKYDWVRSDQIDWIRAQLLQARKYLRPYKPDGGIDLPSQNWTRADSWDANSSQGSRLAGPNAMVFVHIPVPEVFDNATTTRRFGLWRGETATKQGAQKESGLFDALLHDEGTGGVRVIDSGHMHNNGDCEEIVGMLPGSTGKTSKMWTCFGGGASYAGYGDDKIPRTARIFHLTAYGEKADSWTRLDNGTKAYQGKFRRNSGVSHIFTFDCELTSLFLPYPVRTTVGRHSNLS